MARSDDLECTCSHIREHHETWILCMTIPVAIAYFLLFILGIYNLRKFIRAKQLGGTLMQIYLWSMISSFARCLYMLFQMNTLDMVWVTVPIITSVYTKLLFGISYQSSL